MSHTDTIESLRIEVESLREVIRLLDGNDQTKLESRIEVGANYLSGFLIAWLTWTLLVLGPITWGWLTVQNGFAITMVFTVVSILRSYYWRRFFAVGLHKVVHQFIKRTTGW